MDDDSAIAELMSDALEDEGYATHICGDGKAALDFLLCRAGGLAPRRALWYACPDKSQMAKER